MKITKAYSYSFWVQLKSRILDALEEKDAKMEALTRPVHATVLTKDFVLKGTEVARNKVFSLLRETEYLCVLNTIIENTVAEIALTSGIRTKETQKYGAERFLDFYLRYAHNCPDRSAVENSLAFHAERYDSLRNAGNGDLLTTERNQFRLFECEVPVMGREDCVEAEDSIENIQTYIATLDMELKALKANTEFSLRVTDELNAVLAGFKLEFIEVPDEPAEEPAAIEETIEPATTDTNEAV